MVTFRDLCRLHLRDEVAEPDRPLVDRLNDPSEGVTWSMLQRVLRVHHLDPRTLESWADQGRLDEEKLVFCREARELITRQAAHRQASGNRVFGSIHELIWVHGFQDDQTVRFRALYRGHHDSRWGLAPSLLREPLDVQALVERVARTEAFIAELRKRRHEFFAVPPSDDELLAVAQHYGFPTPLLDFTASLRVASWFATSQAARVREPRSLIGAIHVLRYPKEVDGQPVQDDLRIGDFRLFESAGIHPGRGRFLAPRLAEADNRIARQHGLFVADFQPRDLHGITSYTLHFWQQPGEVFEDPAAGVSAGQLLPDDSPLARLAAEVASRLDVRGTDKLTAALGAARLPEPGLFGATGFTLAAAITDSRGFLNRLEPHLVRLVDAEHIRNTIAKVFADYFGLARVRAGSGTDPFAHALAELARLSGADARGLESATRAALAPRCRTLREWSTHAGPWSPAHDVERMALACCLFLASWEVLQHVDGEGAREAASAAFDALGVVDGLLD